MIMLTLHCPKCGTAVVCDVAKTGGDIVPYGSTTARLPEGLEVVPGVDACSLCGLDYTEGDDAVYGPLTEEAERLMESDGPDWPEPEEDEAP